MSARLNVGADSSRVSTLAGALLRGAGLALALQVAGTGLKYLWHLLYARWMGASEYGTFAFAFSWIQLLAVVSALGLTTGVLRFIPAYLAQQDWIHVRGLVRRSRQLTMGAGLLLSVLGTVLIVAISPVKLDAQALVVAAWLVPLAGLLNLQLELTRATQRIGLAYAPPYAVQPLAGIVLGFIIFRGASELTSSAAVTALGVSLLSVLAVQTYLLRQALPRELSAVECGYRTGEWLSVSFPLLLITGFLIVLNQADIIMLGVILGPREAGIYTASTKSAQLASLVLTAVNAMAAPMISMLYTQRDHESLQGVVARAARWVFWPSVAVAAVLIVFAGTILGLFGSEFVDGRVPLMILAFAQLVNASAGPVGYLLTLTGYQNLSATVYGVSALVNVGLNAVLIPSYGMVGAAIATATTMIMWNVWLYVLVRRRLGIRSFVITRW